MDLHPWQRRSGRRKDVKKAQRQAARVEKAAELEALDGLPPAACRRVLDKPTH